MVELFFAIVSSLLCIVFAQSDRCGTSVVTLVTGGKSIVKGEYPWLAALYRLDDEGRWEQFCGGALLSPRLVITAAHCLLVEGKAMKAEDIKVGLGKLYRDYYHNEDTATIANVIQIVVHQRFMGDLSSYALDVGLIKLSVDINMSEYILPVCIDLDTMTTVGTGAKVYAAGWGTTENGTSSEKALAAHLSYLDTRACLNRIDLSYRKFVTQEKFCCMTSNGSQVDRGDSGGALSFVKNGRHYVIGVVSTKVMDHPAFSIFTDLSRPEIHYWLKEEITRLNLPDDNGGFLLLKTSSTYYKAPVGSAKELVFTPVSSMEPKSYYLSVDCVKGDIYYFTVGKNLIKRADQDGTNFGNFKVLEELAHPRSLSVDWIGRRIYWVEQYIGKTEKNLKGANIDSGELEDFALPLSEYATKIRVHPTLRKIYLLEGYIRVQSVDIGSSSPTIALFHEEKHGARLHRIDMDWKTNELCMFIGTDHQLDTIKCKSVVSGTLRTVMSGSEYRWTSGTISPHFYYWTNRNEIYSLSKSSSEIEKSTMFRNTETVLDLILYPETCPTLHSAPRVFRTN